VCQACGRCVRPVVGYWVNGKTCGGCVRLRAGLLGSRFDDVHLLFALSF
jgi:hypothetical protein